VFIVETYAFTKRLTELLNDESYAELQSLLAQRPDAGEIIRGSGGMRKIRWAGSGRGKRGGVRIIYYWWVRRDRISCFNSTQKTSALI
jgi:mRNA-degrading endonuclease RelE of RelBE toxin-antitoxin system